MFTNPIRVVCLATAVASVFVLSSGPSDASLGAMGKAASAWLESLSPELRTKARRSFSDKARLDWHFIPRERQGVSLKEMNAAQRRAAHSLLRTALSTQGYLKARAVMELEAVLFDLESRPDRPASDRDAERYWFMVFGEPSGNDLWGWRVEGHHLLVNLVVKGDRLVSFTPMFFGSNPAEVRSGRHAGLRVLAEEEDAARALLNLLGADLRKVAMISDAAPRDIILAPGRDVAALKGPHGVSGKDMSADQRRQLLRLVSAHARSLRPDDYEREMSRMNASGGVEALAFGWAGSAEPGRGHYYRLVGPTLIVEYDNVQNDANHVHVVWHDPTNDFGHDVLRRHRQTHK